MLVANAMYCDIPRKAYQQFIYLLVVLIQIKQLSNNHTKFLQFIGVDLELVSFKKLATYSVLLFRTNPNVKDTRIGGYHAE